MIFLQKALGQFDPLDIIRAKGSPTQQPQEAAFPKLLPDGPRIQIVVGGVTFSFPVTGGEITLPVKLAGRFYYADPNNPGVLSAKFKGLAREMAARQVEAGGGRVVMRSVFENTIFAHMLDFWNSEDLVPENWSDKLLRAWWRPEGIPMFKFELTQAEADKILASGKVTRIRRTWAFFIRFGMGPAQEITFILNTVDPGLLGTVWNALKNLPHTIIEGVSAFVEEIADIVREIACGPAQPFIDDLAVLAVSGPAGLGAAKMTELAAASGKSQTELAALAANPTATAIQTVTNAILANICGADLPVGPPPAAPTIPAGAVAVFDPATQQFHILAKPGV